MEDLKKVSRFTVYTSTLFLLLLAFSCNEPASVQPHRQFGGIMTAQINGTIVSLSQISITIEQG